jgi:RNA polymerase sigma factor (sigma-70 family)
MTDSELLAKYVAENSQQAFAELVDRHAPTVYSVCLRVTGDAEEAQDALQAAFLVLARKAGTLSGSEPLGGWLFRVAQSAAGHARRSAERRRRHEREAAAVRAADAAAGPAGQLWSELAPHLDAALAALPAAQRDAIVLRYLEGKPEAEICRELGCPQSTLATRLARGIERLREKLAPRGAALSAAALAELLVGSAAPVAPPAAVVVALKGLGAGTAAAASAQIASLAEGTLKTMLLAKLKLAAAVVGAALVVGGGGAVTLALATTSPGEQAVSRLQPGEWFEVPGSKLAESGVFPPKPAPPGSPAAVMSAWGGGALDTKHNRLIVHGGGNVDYAGNEIYVFDLNTFRWTRPWGPEPAAGPYPQNKDEYAAGVPTSVETGDGLVYLPGADLLWRGGGSRWSPGGGGSPVAWTFDFRRLAWQRRASTNCLGVSVCADYDPVTGHIFATCDHYGLAEYDIEKDTWTRRGELPMGEEPNAAIHPVARLFVAVGNGRVGVFNLETGQTSYPKTSGDQTVVDCRGPGLVYDEKLKRLVGWGGGASLYSLDVATWTWTEHRPAATNTVVPAGKPGRLLVLSKFQYWPAKDAYVVVNSVSDSVYFGRIGPAAK